MRYNERAAFALYRPTEADPLPMLEYVRRHYAEAKPIVPYMPLSRRWAWAEKYLLRACFLLRLQGDASDAEWLETYTQREFPDLWRKRDLLFYYTSGDPKLQRLLKSKRNEPWIPKTLPSGPRKIRPSDAFKSGGSVSPNKQHRHFSTRIRTLPALTALSCISDPIPSQLCVSRLSAVAFQKQTFSSRSQDLKWLNPHAKGHNGYVETIEHFDVLAKEGQATIQDAHAILRKAYEESADLPYHERWAAAANAGGGKVLQWLQAQQPREIYPEFAELLCWFTHPEGLDNVVTEWLTVSVGAEAFGSNWHHDRARRLKWAWARDMYAGVIKAHLEWSPDGTMDLAVKRFRHDLASDRLLAVLKTIGIAGVEKWLLKAALRDRSPPCNAELYDWLSSFYIRKVPAAMKAEVHAKFCIYRPTKPDPTPMLAVARKLDDNSSVVAQNLVNVDDSRQFFFYKYMLRTCFLLRLLERVSDAEWLEAKVKEQAPEAWSKRDGRYFHLAQDQKLEHLLKGKKSESWIPRSYDPQTGSTLHERAGREKVRRF